METLLLAAGIPLAYLLGVLLMVRYCAWEAAKAAVKGKKTESGLPVIPSLEAIPSCDWPFCVVVGVLWPVLLPIAFGTSAVIGAVMSSRKLFISREPRSVRRMRQEQAATVRKEVLQKQVVKAEAELAEVNKELGIAS